MTFALQSQPVSDPAASTLVAPVFSVPAALTDATPAQSQAWRELTGYARALRDGIPPLTRMLSDLLSTPDVQTVSDLNALVGIVTGRLGAEVRHLVCPQLSAGWSAIEFGIEFGAAPNRCLQAISPLAPSLRDVLNLLLAPEAGMSDHFSILEAAARFVTLWRFSEASARAAWVDPTDSTALWTSIQRMARRVEQGDCVLRLNPDGTNTLVLRCPDRQVLAAWTMPKRF